MILKLIANYSKIEVESEGPQRLQKALFDEGKPDYLLFLKRREEGRYEHVTGQHDVTPSCREMRLVLNDENE